MRRGFLDQPAIALACVCEGVSLSVLGDKMNSREDRARRMINASICAYQIYARVVIPTPDTPGLRRVTLADGSFYQVVPAYQDAVGFISSSEGYAPKFATSGDDAIDAALVGITDDGYAVVAIRGTLPPSFANNDIKEWLTDWVGDADMHKVGFAVAGRDYGQVEHGFYKAVSALWPFVQAELTSVLPKAAKGVLVTGHSKGGAATYLVAAMILAEWPDLAGQIEVHAFAPAVSVDADFVAQYDAQQLSERTYRYQKAHDIVPFIPLWSGVNVWSAIHDASTSHKLAWSLLDATTYVMTFGGYAAPGKFVYYDNDGAHVLGAEVTTSALPDVAACVARGDYKSVGAAHGVIDSYLPCFAAPKPESIA